MYISLKSHFGSLKTHSRVEEANTGEMQAYAVLVEQRRKINYIMSSIWQPGDAAPHSLLYIL